MPVCSLVVTCGVGDDGCGGVDIFVVVFMVAIRNYSERKRKKKENTINSISQLYAPTLTLFEHIFD